MTEESGGEGEAIQEPGGPAGGIVVSKRQPHSPAVETPRAHDVALVARSPLIHVARGVSGQRDQRGLVFTP